MKNKQSSSNNILYIPSTINQNLLDDKMAYLVHYLYTYPFKYKERVKSLAMSQKKLEHEPTEPGGFKNSQDSCIYKISDTDSSEDQSGIGFSSYVFTSGLEYTVPSYVFTSDNFISAWDGFIPIHRNQLVKWFSTKDYNRVKTDLIERNIITCNWSYSNFDSNRFTMKYALTDINRFSQLTYYEPTQKRFSSKIQKINNQRRTSLSPLLQILEDKLYEIDFDYTSAHKYVTDKTFLSKKTEKPSIQAKESRKMGLQIMKDKSIHDYYLHEGQKVKRVFSPITSLPKDLRQFISFNNNKMWDVDVSAALPTLFNIHLKDLDSEDGKLYRNLTSENDNNFGIYDFLGELWGIGNEKEVKKLTCILFFGNGHTILDIRQKFDGIFPNVYKRMKLLKRGNYKFLAKDLMDLERKIMIDTVVEELLQKDRDMMVITIHDGILVTEDYVNSTKSTIQKTIKDIIGVNPKVKVKSTFPEIVPE